MIHTGEGKTHEIKFLRIWSDDAEVEARVNTQKGGTFGSPFRGSGGLGFGTKDRKRDEKDWHGNVIKNALSYCFEFSLCDWAILAHWICQLFLPSDGKVKKGEKARRKDSWQATWKLVIIFRACVMRWTEEKLFSYVFHRFLFAMMP